MKKYRQRFNEKIRNEKNYIYHEDEPADTKLQKAFENIVNDYYKRTGIIIEKIYVEAIGIKNKKITLENIKYSGGDERNITG